MRVCPRCKSTYTSKTQFCGIDGEQLVEAHDDPLIGEVVGRYRIESKIGRGAAGAVYKAIHTELGSEFAVKVLRGELGSDEELVGRFKREAQAASQIRSINVVSVVDVGVNASGLAYIVMEYARGEPLDKVLKAQFPLVPRRIARIARDIAGGLLVAHELGFVHRDIKPANIFLCREGDREIAKILDFGIVRRQDDDEDDTQLTQQGQVVGTPSYMAPEQWRNSQVSPSADLYALGVVLFEMIEGTRPFRAGTLHGVGALHLSRPPPPLPTLEGLGPLAHSLMAKKPEDRPANAKAVLEEIEDILAHFSFTSTGDTTSHATAPASVAQPRAGSAAPPAETLASLKSSEAEAAIAQPLVDTLASGQDEAILPPTPTPTPAPTRSRGLLITGVVLLTAALATVYVVSSRQPPTVVAEAPVIDREEIEANVASALNARALDTHDIHQLPALAGLAANYKSALQGGAVVQIRDTAKALIIGIENVTITDDFLRVKLDELDTKVASMRSSLSPDQLAEIEATYLKLYKQVTESSDAKSRQLVLRSIHAFESKLK